MEGPQSGPDKVAETWKLQVLDARTFSEGVSDLQRLTQMGNPIRNYYWHLRKKRGYSVAEATAAVALKFGVQKRKY